MPIGSVNDFHHEISVVEPVSPALEHVKQMLFKPFDLGKWFVIGFCAWLAGLGESGGGFNGSYGGNNHAGNGHAQESFRHGFDEARDFVMSNLYWIIPVGTLLLIFFFALGMVLLWLNCRGKFMFLHCVALNRAEVTVPWQKFARVANSLFRFRFVMGLIGMILTLPLLAIIAVLVIKMVLLGRPVVPAIMLAVALLMLLCLLAIFLALVRKFTMDFVVPIMFLRGNNCVSAWKEFFSLLASRPGQFALYILFQIVLGMAIAVMVLFAVLVTCCIVGCLMIIPYIGTVLLLPVLIFKRSYSLYFLQQFGTGYDVFPPAPSAPLPPGTI